MGLKLEATRGPVEVLVIDSVEQPTPDENARRTRGPVDVLVLDAVERPTAD